jgi:hypothetical protein
MSASLQDSASISSGPTCDVLCHAVLCCAVQVFVPREELSLDVISQYNVL